MSEVNQEITRDNPEMMFISAFAGILNLKTGDLEYCNAGHDAPYLFTHGQMISSLDGIGGPPLCILDDIVYPGENIKLTKGQSIMIITDGVTEAMNINGDLYTAKALERYIVTLDENSNADKMVQGLYNDVKFHADGADASDDITIMALTWRGDTR
jgi:serine phosphatase RsbU (regulator of sigma subunit)